MPFTVAAPQAVAVLLELLQIDPDRLAGGGSLGLPFPTLQQRAYELGRADGLFAAACDPASSLEALGEALESCRALRRAGGTEDESALMRPYARGVWQGYCLLALEMGERGAFDSLLAEVEPLRLAEGHRLETEIDVQTARARQLWQDARTSAEVRELALRSARIAWLSDFATQRARDRFILNLAERGGRSDPSAALRELRERLLASAAVAPNGDHSAHLRRQAFTFVGEEELRQLFPSRHQAAV
jgi:hypothetical protein